LYPTTTEHFAGEVFTTDAFPFEKYLFSHFTLNYGTLDFDSSLTVNGFSLDTTDTLTAHFLLKEVIPQTMYVPSGFTPNGDGINDVFKPYHTETVVNGNVRIFNRWGEEVFVSDKLDFEWDGTKNGRLMPDDVYYFVLNYYLDSDYFETVQGRISISR
jgi:gliding motility-associated-like protein